MGTSEEGLMGGIEMGDNCVAILTPRGGLVDPDSFDFHHPGKGVDP